MAAVRAFGGRIYSIPSMKTCGSLQVMKAVVTRNVLGGSLLKAVSSSNWDSVKECE